MALQYYGGQVPLLHPPSSALPAWDTAVPFIPLSPSTSEASALDEQLLPASSLEVDKAFKPSSACQPKTHDCSGTSDTTALVEAWVSNALATEDQMKQAKTKATIGILSTLIAYVSLNSLAHVLRPNLFIWSGEDREEPQWIASSESWLDRKACRWLGFCGTTHFRKVRKTFGRRPKHLSQVPLDSAQDQTWQDAWNEGKESPQDWSMDERVLREIPQYVMDYAPLVHLFSGEQFWPCDIAEHLYHITPHLNYTPVQPAWQHPKLTNLDELNEWDSGRHIFLTSNDNVEERPAWLEGEKNIPEAVPGDPKSAGEEEALAEWDGVIDADLPEDLADGQNWEDVGEGGTQDRGGDRPPTDHNLPIPSQTSEGDDFLYPHIEARHTRRFNAKKGSPGGRSEAPAVLIVVDKGSGIVDAFWFYFYSFNLGNTVLNVRFGNHVGDWEHSMVRFKDGKPKSVFVSEHSFGEAYKYEAVEKIGVRPVIYAARGTHANYATPGLHPYILPYGVLHDETDRGPLWDPALNSHSYTYNYITDELRSSNFTPKAPIEWFYFTGHWGDKFYPLGDRRQYRFAGQYHYVNGPIGPRFKHLGRRKPCAGKTTDPCPMRSFLSRKNHIKRWHGPGIGDQLTEEDVQRVIGNHTYREDD